MMRSAWPTYEAAGRQSRLSLLADTPGWTGTFELATLLAAGCGAAMATGFLDLGLRIPGHAIIRAVFPMAFGLAAAPRRGAGCVMGGSALASAACIHFGGFASIGVGAVTSLCVTGPLLDLAVCSLRPGRSLWLRLGLAGMMSNTVAFMVRGGVKLAGADHATGRPFAAWWPQAVWTYLLCGLLAGLLSAAVWFRFQADRDSEADREEPR